MILAILTLLLLSVSAAVVLAAIVVHHSDRQQSEHENTETHCSDCSFSCLDKNRKNMPCFQPKATP